MPAIPLNPINTNVQQVAQVQSPTAHKAWGEPSFLKAQERQKKLEEYRQNSKRGQLEGCPQLSTTLDAQCENAFNQSPYYEALTKESFCELLKQHRFSTDMGKEAGMLSYLDARLADTSKTVECAHGPLDTNDLDAFLQRTGNYQTVGNIPQNFSKGGVRLICTHTILTTRFDRPDASWEPVMLPFSRKAFLDILREFKLPPTWLDMRFSRSGIGKLMQFCLLKSRTKTLPGQFSLLLRFPHQFNGQAGQWSVAMTYDPLSQMTYGIFDGVSVEYVEVLAGSLKHNPELACHPLQFAMFLLEQSASFSVGSEKWFENILFRLQRDVGNYVYRGQDPPPDPKNLDYDKHARSLTYCGAGFNCLQRRAEFDIKIAKELLKLNEKVAGTLPTESEVIGERIYNASSLLENILDQASRLQEQVKSQESLLYSLVSQHDNQINADIAKATKRDSSAMTTIAILTIIFLPGAFVAALFSMNMFNWDAGAGEPVVSSRFKYYWAVTVPLTIVVIMVWIITNLLYLKFRSWQKKRERAKRDQKRGDKIV